MSHAIGEQHSAASLYPIHELKHEPKAFKGFYRRKAPAVAQVRGVFVCVVVIVVFAAVAAVAAAAAAPPAVLVAAQRASSQLRTDHKYLCARQWFASG